MRSFCLCSALLLVTSASTLAADQPASADNAEPAPVVVQDQYVPAAGVYGTYTDFPSYPAGYSSYHGLGFMGTCCEQLSCCAQGVWDGYCAEKCAGHHYFHGWASRLHCGCHQGCCGESKCGVVDSCDQGCEQKSCCEPACGKSCGASFPCHGPLCGKLHGLRLHGCCGRFGRLSYGERCAPLDGQAVPVYGEPQPAEAEQPEAAPPAPEPKPQAAPEPPTDVTTDFVPTFPDRTENDRSARRSELRRLPAV